MTADALHAVLTNNVRIFLLCCELRNFTSAAHALGMTSSAVSKAMQTFEQELGFTLFERNVRPLGLTPEARLLRGTLEKLMGGLGEAVSQIGLENHMKPALRIGMIESLTNNLGAAVVRRMRPMLSHLSILTASADVLSKMLLERRLDLIVTNDHDADAFARLRRIRILSEPTVVLMPRDAPIELTEGVPTWEELRLCGLPLIRYWKDSGAGRVNELFLRTQGIRFTDTLEVYSNALLVELVAQGFGWALIRPSTMLESAHSAARVKVLASPAPVLDREVYIEGREDYFTREADLLRAVCEETLAEEIAPRLKAIAPWAAQRIVVGAAPTE